MKSIYKSLLLVCLCVINTTLIAQISTNNYYSSIKSFDLSKLWLSGKINSISEGLIDTEPLGFIGDNYQRFYIHYTSVIKDASNPYKYLIKGKTRVKDNICSFAGTITILKAELYKESDNPKYKEGRVICSVDFKEDSSQVDAGFIKGTLITNWCSDKQRNIIYDSINSEADGFDNNQCEATWTSYKTHKSKICNWGDFRIPKSKDLDKGAGEVSVNPKYIKNGWENYMKSLHTNEPGNKEAVKEENRKWWL